MNPSDIATIRARMGLSQARLANVLGVHETTIANWERGRHAIPPPAALLLRTLAPDHAAELK